MVCAAQFSCCTAKFHFFYSSPEMNSNEYSTRIMNKFESQVNNIEEIKQQLLNSGKP